jgi:hypothetical protein
VPPEHVETYRAVDMEHARALRRDSLLSVRRWAARFEG